MVLWISNIIYTSGIIENIFLIDKINGENKTGGQTLSGDRSANKQNFSNIMMDYYAKNVQWNKRLNDNLVSDNVSEKIEKLKHPPFEISNRLSSFHFAGILSKQYNISMIGRYVSSFKIVIKDVK